MTLTTGARIGPYEVVTPLGAGGMGEVYRARDTRLDRTVAIKVLPAEIAGDPQARERFEREARAVAALNHPHICTLHDIGRHVAADGSAVDYLVLEHLEGETLAARLARGPLPLDQALRCATEIASALDRAHRAGIVHRDIKPANIMLTKAGTSRQAGSQSKLLDFGIAKAGPVSTQGETIELTQPGLRLGTVQYMAPEQLDGRPVDARTDLFAFGAVLYEMVTGRKAFEGAGQASVIAAIMERDPPRASAAQPLAPVSLDHLVATCLEKDPDDRWQSARDVELSLRHLATENPAAVAEGPAPRARVRERLAWLAAAVGLIAAMVLAATAFPRTPVTRPTVRFLVAPPDGEALAGPVATVQATQLALSPDGRRLVFVASSAESPWSLWVRDLDNTALRLLPGTGGASYPFWSPDGRTVGFFANAKLKRVDTQGGTPQVLCDAPEPRGGTWNRDGVIVFAFSNSASLHRIAAAGGTPTVATELDAERGEVSHRFPQFLPDGRHLLYYVRSTEHERSGVYATTLGSSDARRILDSRWSASYARPGHLLFLTGGTLMAQRFDADTLQLVGEPSPVTEGVGGSTTDHAAFSVSETGVLAFGGDASVPTRLTWFTRTGTRLEPLVPPGNYVTARLSPDQRRLAFSRVDEQTNTPDVWILDLARGTSSRFTTDIGLDTHPAWSPDGQRVVFRSYRSGLGELYEKASSGGQGERLIAAPGIDKIPNDWSRDGHVLVYSLQAADAATRFDIWTLMFPEGDARSYLSTEFTEMHPRLSPDGRFIAYASDESGQFEVYVQTFPVSKNRWPVSQGGGAEPVWRKDGRELFYLGSDGKLRAVAVRTDPDFEAGTTMELFETHIPVRSAPYRFNYDVTDDGQRFVVNTAIEGPGPRSISVVLDWAATLRR